MKKMLNSVLACVAVCGLFLAGCSSSKNATADPSPAARAIYTRVANGDYVVRLNESQTMQGIPPLTDNYTLEIKGDSVHSRLPYFGRSYYNPPGIQNERLMFDGAMYEYQVGFAKHDAVRVLFGVLTKEDRYVYELIIWPNEKVNLNITPQKKSSIMYVGTLLPE